MVILEKQMLQMVSRSISTAIGVHFHVFAFFAVGTRPGASSSSSNATKMGENKIKDMKRKGEMRGIF